VNGEAANPNGFAYKSPVWPPRLESAAYVGADTICARITVPSRDTILGKSMLEWLAMSGDVFNNGTFLDAAPQLGQELTVYTAFTAKQCNQFQQFAQGVELSDAAPGKPSRMSLLRLKLCNTPGCNKPAPRLPPANLKNSIAETNFPGRCPVANPNPTGCYCTTGCGFGGQDAAAFPYKSPSWPAPAYSPKFVGSDTICARITVPIFDPSVVESATFIPQMLQINGKFAGEDVQSAPPGSEVTVYTAFTADQCATFVTQATKFATVPGAQAIKWLGIFLCNTTNCNGIATNRITPMKDG
jgi:hypothetical protein